MTRDAEIELLRRGNEMLARDNNQLRAALAVCAAKFTRDADDRDAAAGELSHRMQVAFNALNGLDLNNGLTHGQGATDA